MSSPSVRVRPARAGDAGFLAQLSGALGYPTNAAHAADRLAALQDADNAVFVAEHDMGVPVGWVHVFVARRLESEPFAEIGGLVVDEAHRGAGIGAGLVRAAESWARARGLAEMRVRANVVRELAHRFYATAGYTAHKRQAVFIKPLG